MGTEKIGKLLMQYAIPAIIAMTASSLYNMVDSIFIGHGVGAMAISGLALTFPLMNLAAAFGSLVGVGGFGFVVFVFSRQDVERFPFRTCVVGIFFGPSAAACACASEAFHDTSFGEVHVEAHAVGQREVVADVVAFVGETLACEAVMMAQVVKNKK